MQPLRGTKDILPNEMILWQHLYNQTLKVLTSANYHEIRTPIIEPTLLFKRTIGDTTDIVTKEMYSFCDRAQRDITLRPEGTASIARAFITHKLHQNSNIQRLWYFGPMFRYERPQNGRQRQFHQLGLECIGSINPMADAEIINMAITILESVKCNNYTLEINSIGNSQEREDYKYALIDYLDSYHKDLDKNSQRRLYTNPLRILDSKDSTTQEILYQAPKLNKYLNKESLKHFDSVCEYLNQLQMPYIINPKLVRGLDYYNYTAFEVKTDALGSQDTICGGGRYDNLIKQLGGPETPSIGCAIGIERLLLIIQKNLTLEHQPVDLYLITLGNAAKNKIWTIIPVLQKHGLKFDLDLSESNIHRQLKRASKLAAICCLILADNEIANNTITIKWLNTGTQRTFQYHEFIKEIQNKTLIHAHSKV